MAKKTSSKINYFPKREFEFVFHKRYNKIAYNCDELAQMMWEDMNMGAAHLFYIEPGDHMYQESIENTLRQAGLNEKADALREIKEDYTDDHGVNTQGVLCACLCLSDKTPLSANSQVLLGEVKDLPALWHEYGIEWDDSNEVIPIVANPAFYYWLSHRDPHLASFVRRWQDQDLNPYRIAYSMFPDMSYDFITDSKDSKAVFTPSGIGEMLNSKVMNSIKRLEAIPDLAKFDLEPGGRVESYLLSRRQYAPAIERIKACINSGRPNNTSNKPTTSRSGSKKGILESYIQSNPKYSSLVGKMIPSSDSPYDMSDLMAPHNRHIVLFRIIKALSGKVWYEFPDGTRVYSPDELKNIPDIRVRDALMSGHLADWIAVFYQADPDRTFPDAKSFAEESIKFTEYVGSLFKTYVPFRYEPEKRYTDALEKIDATAATFNKYSKTGFETQILRLFFVPVACLLFLSAAVMAFLYDNPPYFKLAAFFVVVAAFAYFASKLRHVYDRVPDYAHIDDISRPDFKTREMEALQYAYRSPSSKEKPDTLIKAKIHSFKNRKKAALKSQFGYSLGAIATAAVFIVCIVLFSRYSS